MVKRGIDDDEGTEKASGRFQGGIDSVIEVFGRLVGASLILTDYQHRFAASTIAQGWEPSGLPVQPPRGI